MLVHAEATAPYVSEPIRSVIVANFACRFMDASAFGTDQDINRRAENRVRNSIRHGGSWHRWASRAVRIPGKSVRSIGLNEDSGSTKVRARRRYAERSRRCVSTCQAPPMEENSGWLMMDSRVVAVGNCLGATGRTRPVPVHHGRQPPARPGHWSSTTSGTRIAPYSEMKPHHPGIRHEPSGYLSAASRSALLR